jgi:hypothetical protein
MIKSRITKWAREGDEKNEYKILAGKPEWGRQIGRPRRRWKDSIRTNLGKVGWEDVD